MNDSDLRARIFERSPHFGGSQYEHELPGMLPRSDCSVFMHMDIAPRNILVDEGDKVTGLLDWEYAGWYPGYWGICDLLSMAWSILKSFIFILHPFIGAIKLQYNSSYR